MIQAEHKIFMLLDADRASFFIQKIKKKVINLWQLLQFHPRKFLT